MVLEGPHERRGAAAGAQRVREDGRMLGDGGVGHGGDSGHVGPPPAGCRGARRRAGRANTSARQGASPAQHDRADRDGTSVTYAVVTTVAPSDGVFEDVLNARGHPDLLPRSSTSDCQTHAPRGVRSLSGQPRASTSECSARSISELDDRSFHSRRSISSQTSGVDSVDRLSLRRCWAADRPERPLVRTPPSASAQSTQRIRRRASTQQVAQSRSSQRAHWVSAASNGWWTHALTAIPRTFGALTHSGRSSWYRQVTLRG